MNDAGRRPIRRVLMSVYDKTDLVPTRGGPGRRRGRDRVHRVDGPGDRRGRAAGDPGRAGHRLPGVPGRPGQDPPSGRPRGPAGRSAAGVAPRPARRPGHRAVRPAGQQPVPLQCDRRFRRHPGRVRGADRHRRSGDGAQLGQEPRIGGRRDVPGPVPGAARGAGVRRVHPGRAAGPGRGGVRAYRRVRRGRGRLAAAGGGRAATSRSRPGRVRPTGGPPCCVTGRTRTSPPPSTAPRRPFAGWRPPSSGTARRCPTTTTSTRTRPDGRRTTSTSRRWRSSSTPTPAGSPSGRTWPRPTAGPTPATRSRPSAG